MRTVVNIRAGGRSPISGAVHSIVLLAVVVGASPAEMSSDCLCKLSSVSSRSTRAIIWLASIARFVKHEIASYHILATNRRLAPAGTRQVNAILSS